ncbi:type I-E CRISPR-associated protein Cas5/CasD [Kitasatospora sp. YST-16]|uniref:type I-E CRISPR-associated protein Cas5/CasD n=1 Tax=Kitasatospora sp. YST-16 TaxID=2998080 RepID=UPI00228539FE|nr:type I-E CRISPR-associated protein Cas5/CasD [Kitasatospora sp. YST-16]WAL74515.1 type I-E CRISPR-associated protein Cas5/CasD [Kitasatospora sp. YST-16]WNW40576.1 type I-E CRISPR-associated protein Cas5/CasD [Streptomyces sp. Li-HN-5-13]
MTGILLHLSSPMQSWGLQAEHHFHPTEKHPTRSGLIGLIASAMGRPDTHPNSDLRQLDFTIRVDRPGQREIDFHTIGGGLPAHLAVPRADGSPRTEGTATIVTERAYLCDAAFTVAVTGPAGTVADAARALARPVFAPYLGRRSCPPDVPVFLTACPDALDALDHLPLHRPPSPPWDKEPRPVGFVHDTPPEPGAPPDRQLRDQPLPGGQFTDRNIWYRTRTLPAPDAGLGTAYLNALAHYLEEQR